MVCKLHTKLFVDVVVPEKLKKCYMMLSSNQSINALKVMFHTNYVPSENTK